ncbi:MAG TPA: hypothetical protein VM681_07525 [Candidatus Thermoplasmatota archaeon]|nr:hypothetical protein [Candidatus Thermoplasmatota archaeon]
MATTTERMGTGPYDATMWPGRRLSALAGGILGLVMAVLLLVGSYADVATPMGTDFTLGGALVGGIGVVHLILALLVFASVYLLFNNERLHGGLLIVYGIIGVVLGFGFFLGAILVIVGGALSFVSTPAGTMGRRPVT